MWCCALIARVYVRCGPSHFQMKTWLRGMCRICEGEPGKCMGFEPSATRLFYCAYVMMAASQHMLRALSCVQPAPSPLSLQTPVRLVGLGVAAALQLTCLFDAVMDVSYRRDPQALPSP
jgi:hypothetical protein